MRQYYLYSYSLQIIYIACVCMSPLCAREFAHRVIIVNIAATKAQLLSWICVYGHFVKMWQFSKISVFNSAELAAASQSRLN